MEHTLKVLRIPLRADFQVAIVSLSPSARAGAGVIGFRLPRTRTFFRISSTTLWSGVVWWTVQSAHCGLTHVVNRSIALRAGLLRSSSSIPFICWSNTLQISAQRNPISTRSMSSVIEAWICEKLEQLMIEEEETYLDLSEKFYDSDKSGLG